MMTKKSRSNDQAKLKILSDFACDDIEGLLSHFDLDYKHSGRMITMCCPIHGGDNPSAINLYPEGDNYRGNWKCRTHGCEEYFKGSIIGFVRGVLSNKLLNWEKNGDPAIPFDDAVKFLSEFTNKDLKNIHVSHSDRNKRTFTSLMNYVGAEEQTNNNKISRDQVIKTLEIPSSYFLDRNYTSEILNKYDVGLCTNPTKAMYNRVVVPIYDNEYKYMIGCSGRSIFEKCDCGYFHNPKDSCPDKENAWKFSKWKHSANFKSQNCLYNLWFAKKHILESGVAIIVESPGNVWRLEEAGIHNSVAVFGANMTDRQKILLDSSGAMSLVILTDNDEAGRKASQQMEEKCKNTYRIYIPKFSGKDIGDMSIDQINNEIKPILEKIL